MNTIVNTSARLSESRLVAAIAGIPQACWSAMRRFVRLRSDRALLYEMPDHLLRDIGISRSEINSITAFRGSDPSRRRRG